MNISWREYYVNKSSADMNFILNEKLFCVEYPDA